MELTDAVAICNTVQLNRVTDTSILLIVSRAREQPVNTETHVENDALKT